jgi:hypothetical protein
VSYFVDLLHSISKNKTLLGGAILIAICTGALLWYAPKYDSPPNALQSKKADISVLGRRGTLELSCDCPPYTVAQRSRNLNFRADIKLSPIVVAPPKTPSSDDPSSVSVNLNAPSNGQDSYNYIDVASDLFSKGEVEKYLQLNLKPTDSDSSGITFELVDYRTQGGQIVEIPATIYWAIPVRVPFVLVLLPGLIALLIFFLALFLLHSMNRRWQQEEQQLKDAQTRAAENSEQASPTWEFAGTNLQQYFTRNLAQVRQVFYVSVGVMLVGFAFVLYGVYEQIALVHVDPNHISPPTWVASISGIITQFIGATFMVIYRSTMAQANEFVTVLDRINTVGIAVKVLDQIPNTDTEKNAARADFIGLLLGSRAKRGETATKRPSSPQGSGTSNVTSGHIGKR